MIENETVVRELGRGTYGVVELVKTKDGKFYAKKEVGDAVDILVGVREMDVMYRAGCLHPNIVEAHDYNIEIKGEEYNIRQYMEFCSGGSLEKLLETESRNPDRGINRTLGTVKERVQNLARIAHALATLQDYGIYHMDIKTENILYRTCRGMSSEMCLCDFSNYYLKTPWKTGMQAPVIPLEAVLYRPPEIGFLRNTWETYERADVWAFGVVVVETLGGWDFVQAMDSKAVSFAERIRDLIGKIRFAQTNFLKRNSTKAAKMGFKSPESLLLSQRILRDGLNMGKALASQDTSIEKEMIMTLIYARELSSNVFISEGLRNSLDYFTLRDGEMMRNRENARILERLFQDVLPRCFKINHQERISMRDLSNFLYELVSGEKFVPVSYPFERESGGLWSRVVSLEWKKTVIDFYECSKNLDISYGHGKIIKTPVNLVLFAKRISEEYLQMVSSAEDYDMLLSASVFIASELLDFVFPYQDCPEWFNESRTLSKIAPYVKLISEKLMGNLGTLGMNEGEWEVISSSPDKQLLS